jgi:hypothetical protein
MMIDNLITLDFRQQTISGEYEYVVTRSWLVKSRINLPRPQQAAYLLPQFDLVRYYPAAH